jgi:micrococcal nuclease
VKKKIFLFLFFLFSCSPRADYSHIKVIEVIDGDTVKLADGRLLRYIGIDTPEIRLKQNNRFIYHPQPYALEAKKMNKRLVENKFVKIEFDVQKTDAYGRLLGYCFVGSVFVNAKLVEDGYAVIYTMPPNVKYADFFALLQKQARQSKRGLWGAYGLIEHTQAREYMHQIRTVKGRITAAHRTKKCILLYFDRKTKGEFKLVIFNNALKYFSAKGIDPLNFYTNKTVEVSGRIKDYHGPEIIVNSPADIQIIDEK